MPIRQQSVTPKAVREMSSQDPRLSQKRVFVLSDVRLLREGLVLALSHQPSVLVVGSSDLSVSPTGIANVRPDVVLLDAAERDNLKLVHPLRQIVLSAKIVAFALGDIDEDIIACAEAGISGYISRTGTIEDVMASVDAAICGEVHCSPRTSALLFHHVALLSGKRSPVACPSVLTRREGEIVALVEQGLSNKEIARFLQIGNATVKNHVHSILNKLQVRRRGEVAAWSRRANAGMLRKAIFGVFVVTIRMVDSLSADGVCAERLNCVLAAFI
jgi:two-component system nitrate/nitrite response regulator NarL